MKKNIFIALTILLLTVTIITPFFPPSAHKFAEAIFINLSHLDFLHSRLTAENGSNFDIWAIYSEPETPGNPNGPYKHKADPDEGLSCVDDVARAAIVYLWHFEQSGSRKSLASARAALNFVTYMQTQEGLFYNFIFPDGKINRDGITSIPSMGFWTLRALWALTEGYRIFNECDHQYALSLRMHIQKVLQYLKPNYPDSPLYHYGEFKTMGTRKIPLWLINNSSDESALAVIALCTLYEIEQDSEIKDMVEKYVEGILSIQGDNPALFPYCSFPSWTPEPNVWHAWGSRQMMALAKAGRLFNQRDWIDAAEAEANNLIIHLLASHGLIFGMGPAPILNPSQPYGDEVLVNGLIELYQATGRKNYAIMAGLMGSWLMGNNSAGKPVYLSENGRVFDGVDGNKLNINSGAEATVSGLLALLRLRQTPLLLPYLSYKEESSSGFTIVEAESRKNYVTGACRIKAGYSKEGIYSGNGYVEMKKEDQLTIPFEIDDGSDYILYLVLSMEEKSRIEVQHNGGKPLMINDNTEGFLAQYPIPLNLVGSKTHTLTLRLRSDNPKVLAHIDALILQREIEVRKLENPAGNHLILIKSFKNQTAKKIIEGTNHCITTSTYDNHGNLKVEQQFDSYPIQVTLPPYGYCIVEEK